MNADLLNWRVAAARLRSQEALQGFLRADIALAFTFLETAEIDRESDPVQCKAAIGKAQEALATIRGFEARLEDPAHLAEIHESADSLELAISHAEKA